MASFFALITPFDPALKPDQGLPTPTPPGQLPGTPPRPDNTLPGDLPRPEHPIYYPLPPNAPVDPSYGIPEDGPHPDQGLPGPQPHPEHPIVLPPGGGNWLPVYIDNTLPGDQPRPDNTLPGPQPHPEHPIVIPPDIPVPPELGFSGTIKFKAIWTPENGWQTIGVIIPGSGGKPIPTPSKKK
jgi:hypothetical protein